MKDLNYVSYCIIILVLVVYFRSYLVVLMFLLVFFFFFQAEDGIRDKLVTGVQTCALPIFGSLSWDQVKKIAEDKIVDMNCFTIESAMSMVAGTARSMGVTVTGDKPF